MNRPDDLRRVRHMLDHAAEAVQLVRGHTREDLDTDRLLALAAARLLEIVGEAAGRVSRDFRERHDAIPWADIVGLRNRLIHGYDSVDHDILWDILTADLPPLVAHLRDALVELEA